MDFQRQGQTGRDLAIPELQPAPPAPTGSKLPASAQKSLERLRGKAVVAGVRGQLSSEWGMYAQERMLEHRANGIYKFTELAHATNAHIESTTGLVNEMVTAFGVGNVVEFSEDLNVIGRNLRDNLISIGNTFVKDDPEPPRGFFGFGS